MVRNSKEEGDFFFFKYQKAKSTLYLLNAWSVREQTALEREEPFLSFRR